MRENRCSIPRARRACALTAVVLALAACSERPVVAVEPQKGEPESDWKEPTGSPVIRMGQAIPNMLWNDPSVLKEGDGYRMWLSGGDPRGKRIVVALYAARSSDGRSWQIDKSPVLSPDPDPRRWDSLRTETPSVVRAGGTYHLYYSGCDEAGAGSAVFSIGHATSADGVRWTKDPANPVVTRQERDRHQWGYWSAIEPGAVYDPRSRTFYLYYVAARHSRSTPEVVQLGILLARSKDGSRFEHYTDSRGERALVLTRNIENAIGGAWFGFSSPSALIDAAGRFHLFCSFLVAPGGPTTARQVSLAHAVGPDGTSFQVLDEKILATGHGGWRDHDVRAASVLEEKGRFSMWFAGETRVPHYGAAIGFAVHEQP